MSQVRILIVTLFSGEKELDECIESVRSQQQVEVVHEVIKNLPKQLAHQKLFNIFNRRSHEFDYMVKLDADMKFSRPDALVRLLQSMRDGVDLLSVSVWDGMTCDYMQSVNIYSSRCSFASENNDPLFTDRVPTSYPGRQVYKVDPERLVLHAFNPSPFQAFTFGVHRAMKVMQYGVRRARIENAYHQMRILKKVALNHLENGSEPARLACVGAGMVMGGQITSAALVARDDYRKAFSESNHESFDKLLINACSVPPMVGVLRLWGVTKFALGVWDYVCRKGAQRWLRRAE